MKTIKWANALKTGALSAALLGSAAANAELVTQLIHFDDASNGWKWYSTEDRNFLFDPVNLQSSTQCADSTSGGNGSCVIEGTQGVLPRMTRPEFGTTNQGHANQSPDPSGNLLSFTLDSFYFLLTGNGEGAANAITAEGSNGAMTTLQLGGTYTDENVTGAVSFYEGTNEGDPAGPLVKNIGYTASFGTLFDDVDWIQFSAPSTAQVRLDCIVATFDGTTTDPTTDFADHRCGDSGGPDDPPTTSVPEPGTLALLAAGLLGMRFARRRVNV